MFRNIIDEFYKTPAGLIRFGLRGALAETPEYFQFGPAINCYGRLCSQPDQPRGIDEEMREASESVQQIGTECLLPFDPGEVRSNLLCERYLQEHRHLARRIIRHGYYLLRPLLPVPLRKHLQRRALHGWEQHCFPSWPVDRSVDLLAEQLLLLTMKARGLTEVPFIWFWPEGKDGCIVMTHDVETQIGLDACDDLMALDTEFGIPSSFQLVPAQRYRVSESVLEHMRSRGFEVNVHDWNHDGSLFRNRKVFLERARKINECAAEWRAEGFRSGALYRNPDWIEDLHIAYDMSVPNVAHLDPQHGGCCTVFPWFNGNVLEIPLTMIQDYALFHFLNRYSLDLWKQQLKLIVEANGMASFIVHPDYIQEKRARSVYRDLLTCLRELREESNLWVAVPGEINRWWRARHQMRLVQNGNQWQIVGEGNQRARLAFARIENDRIVYSVSPTTASADTSEEYPTDEHVPSLRGDA